uniref:Uncharacterized protein n=1 Tax=Meloidogyne incognita TaxID=6306 RepID=A0A914KPI2_MELIC
MSNCYLCFLPFNCYEGKYCYIPPTRPPKTCKNDRECPNRYKCEYDICVPDHKTTGLQPTTIKPTQCCWWGNRFINCYPCFPQFLCYQGLYCKYVRPTTTPPTTTTTPPPTTYKPCGEKGECSDGFKCEYDYCIPKEY